MDWIQTVLAMDPRPIMERVNLESYTRRQNLSMQKMWPNEPGICACGCNVLLTGRQRRWASNACTIVPAKVFYILQGDTDVIYDVIATRDGEKCNMCQKTGAELWDEAMLDRTSRLAAGTFKHTHWDYSRLLQVDHIVPVCAGGGGCWLDNYQLLCKATCHKQKSREDRRKCH